MTTLADVLEFKGLSGWACDGDKIVHWDETEAGREMPSKADLTAWRDEYEAQGGAAKVEDLKKDRQAASLSPSMRALVMSLNDGSFVPGSRYTGTQITDILKAKL